MRVSIYARSSAAHCSHKMRPHLIILVSHLHVSVISKPSTSNMAPTVLWARTASVMLGRTGRWWNQAVGLVILRSQVRAHTRWGREKRGGTTPDVQFCHTAYTVLRCVTYCSVSFFIKNATTLTVNRLTAIVDLSRFNNSCLKCPTSTLVDLTFQSRALRSFSLNQLRNLSL